MNIGYPSSPVHMDWSVSMGADMLQAEMESTPGHKTTVGVSQGGLVIAETKRRLMELAADDRPAADELTFIAVGDPSNPHGGLFRHLERGYVLPLLGVTVEGHPRRRGTRSTSPASTTGSPTSPTGSATSWRWRTRCWALCMCTRR